MKKFFSALSFLILFFGATSVHAQVNPGYQIKWPTNCTVGKIYSPFANTCVAFGVISNLTFDSSGGAPSGSIYDGTHAFTVSFATVGAPSVSGVNATGTWSISILGNAATATAFATTPTTCPTGQFATGINISGNAICGSITPRTCNGNGCYKIDADGTVTEWGHTADLGGSGSTSITLPFTFPTSCDSITVSTVSSTDRITFLNASSGTSGCGTSSFNVGNNGTSASASWIAIGH